MPEGPITVFLADHHPIFARGLDRLLEDYPEVVVVGCSFSGAETIEEIHRLEPQVAVIANLLPKYRLNAGGQTKELPTAITSADVLRAIKDTKTEVIVLDATADPDSIYESLGIGAAGFVLKTIECGDLIPIIEKAAQGVITLPTDISSNISGGLKLQVARRDSGLTAREAAILQLISEGVSVNGVAHQLTISPSTVRAHKRHVMTKLDTHTIAAAVAVGWRLGILN